MLGGEISAPAASDQVDATEIHTLGNCCDFGNLDVATRLNIGISNGTRGVNAGGTAPSANPTDVIQFVTIASMGDFSDFGNLTQARRTAGAAGSDTRGLVAGGTPEHLTL